MESRARTPAPFVQTVAGTVVVAVVEVTVVGQNGVAGLDKKPGQVFVLVVLVLFEHEAVLLLTNGTVGVILVGRQLIPIIPNFLGEVKDGVVVCRYIAGVINRNMVWV